MSKLAIVDQEACEAASKFTKLFYEAADRKRNKINFLYMDNASLVWNGNVVHGPEAISNFYDKLPTTSHVLISIDCHFLEGGNDASKSLVVVCVGSVMIGQMTHAFSQTFVLVLDDERYKILSDRFRYID